jgi:DNA-binding response OmpR family regulator
VAESAPARRVLVVEDELAIRELLRLHLELAGFVLEESGDGRRALDAAPARPFDLILLDVMLPGLDGVSVCRDPEGRAQPRDADPDGDGA